MRRPVSVLDLSPIASGSTAGDALRNSLDLARHAEALGLRRYWLAEHHNAGGLACPAPEILIGQVAAATRSIRVGSGGIMLPNHTSLKVAETFRVLHALFPGRIDLGLGRAPGTDPRTAAVLRRSREAVVVDEFPEQLSSLMGYLDDDGPPRTTFGGPIRAIPTNVPSPEMWLLGSSEAGGALMAAERGLGFAFAHHINPDDSVRALRRYRDAFVPSSRRREPWAILASPPSAPRATKRPRGSRRRASSRWSGFSRAFAIGRCRASRRRSRIPTIRTKRPCVSPVTPACSWADPRA